LKRESHRLELRNYSKHGKDSESRQKETILLLPKTPLSWKTIKSTTSSLLRLEKTQTIFSEPSNTTNSRQKSLMMIDADIDQVI